MKAHLPNSVVSWLEKSSSSYNKLLGPVAVFARSEFLHRLTNSIDKILPHLFLIIDYFFVDLAVLLVSILRKNFYTKY